MKLQVNRKLRWLVAFFCAACWAYALVARFTSFFMAPRLEKIILLGAALFACSIFSTIIFFGPLSGISSSIPPKEALKFTFFGALFTIALIQFIIPPLYFPENHTLEITPFSISEDKSLTIISIQRIEMPSGEKRTIYPSQWALQGDWKADSDKDTVTLKSEPEAKLSFSQLMQAGIDIKFRTGPRQSQARIVWDGQEHVLDLFSPSIGTQSLVLPPPLDFQRADLTRKVLVGSAKAAEFVGLSTILCLAMILLLMFTWRSVKTLIFGTAVLLILIPLANIADPSVQFQDPRLEEAIRDFLKQPDGMLHKHKLLTIAQLDASARGITSLEGIQMLPNLASLDLSNNLITDITQVSQLKHLRDLNLRANSISMITPLINLTKLEALNLRENPILNLSPLSQLVGLRKLDLGGIQIDNITPISTLIDLRSLNLRENSIEDISLMGELIHLREVDLRGNKVSDIAPLMKLTHLEHLDLRDNSVTDITPLITMAHMRELDLRGNSVRDITPLAAMVNLRYLDLQGNPVSDLSTIRKLRDIEDLNLSYIPLGDKISLLRDLTNLRRLSIRNCDVSDVSIISQLMTKGALQDDPVYSILARVDIRDNPIPRKAVNGYASLRPFWKNISERIPFVLPADNTVNAPIFSQQGGFYEQAFWLTLSAQDPHAEIHYTLDGSEPTRDSPLYNQPMRIQSRTGEPNQISTFNTTSPRWIEPLGEVFKATVVRAKVFLLDGSHSETSTHTYFVDKDITGRFTLPVISLSTDQDYFFDYDQGIYVMGKVWDDENTHEVPTWQKQPANYHQRGGLWERPVHIEFFDSNGSRQLAQDGGVRIHGNWTRSFRQKTLRLIADDWYGEPDSFRYQFFPGLHDEVTGEPIMDFKKLLLRNSGNDWDYNMFADAMIQNLVSHTSLDVQAYRPVIMFFDGEYWGIHNLRERLDADYLAAHYHVAPDQVVILEKIGLLADGIPGDEAPYLNLVDYLGSHDLADLQVYTYAASQIDMENFIDYMITEIFIRNTDWPKTNIKFWRYKTDGFHPDAPYGQDGRWRWMLYDTEQGFGLLKEEPDSYKLNTLEDVLNQSGNSVTLLPELIKNPEFRIQFINRFADHLNTTFESQRVINIIDKMQADIAPEMPEHIRRWRTMNDSMGVWQENVDRMRTFARERPEYMRQYIVETFELSGTATITLEADSAKGYIRINSLDIIAGTPGVKDVEKWSGIYFKGVPISISAIAKPGFKFESWDGVDQNKSEIQLILNNDQSLTANFIQTED